MYRTGLEVRIEGEASEGVREQLVGEARRALGEVALVVVTGFRFHRHRLAQRREVLEATLGNMARLASAPTPGAEEA